MAWISPRIWAPGETATASKFNEISDALNALGGPVWTSYTPVWSSTGTAPTMGATTVSGAYRENGGSVELEIVASVGAGFAAGTGFYTFSLPVATSAVSRQVLRGNAIFFDNSEPTDANYFPLSAYRAATGSGLTIGLVGYAIRWSATAPNPPAVGDLISVALEYRK